MNDKSIHWPIRPLGTSADPQGGYFCHYNDIKGRDVKLRAGDHTKANILILFGGRTDWLEIHFPKFARDGDQIAAIGFNQATVSDALIRACAEQGPCKP